MANQPIPNPLPADLPTNWVRGQTVAPSGTDVGLAQQYGYNYLMAAVNAAQNGVNTINTAFTDLATEEQIGDFYTKTELANAVQFVNGVATTMSGALTNICHIETGSYVGTGTSGPSSPNQIVIKGTPVYLIIWFNSSNVLIPASGSSGGFQSNYVFIPLIASSRFSNGLLSGVTPIGFGGGGIDNIRFWYNNSTVFWATQYTEGSTPTSQFNVSGTTYNYLVFCI